MMITFLGDIHGKLERAAQIAYPTGTTVVQIGDMNMGFHNITENTIVKDYGIDYFIRGNHDNPAICRNHPAYLGDYGYHDKLDLFYMSGAHSIDKHRLTEGYNWWQDEELSYDMTCQAVELYEEIKPRIVVTHDCPTGIAAAMGLQRYKIHTNTNHALRAMLDIHKPDLWVFGHYHENKEVIIEGTKFVCVAELDTYTVGE